MVENALVHGGVMRYRADVGESDPDERTQSRGSDLLNRRKTPFEKKSNNDEKEQKRKARERGRSRRRFSKVGR